MTKYPSQFKIYKKIGAAQFGLIRPRQDQQGRIEKDGAILLEVAKSKGEKSYDWGNKISFAIGMSDLTNIFENPIVTTVEKFQLFYNSEEEHHNYYDLNTNQPYCNYIISPKIKLIKRIFKDRLK